MIRLQSACANGVRKEQDTSTDGTLRTQSEKAPNEASRPSTGHDMRKTTYYMHDNVNHALLLLTVALRAQLRYSVLPSKLCDAPTLRETALRCPSRESSRSKWDFDFITTNLHHSGK